MLRMLWECFKDMLKISFKGLKQGETSSSRDLNREKHCFSLRLTKFYLDFCICIGNMIVYSGVLLSTHTSWKWRFSNPAHLEDLKFNLELIGRFAPIEVDHWEFHECQDHHWMPILEDHHCLNISELRVFKCKMPTVLYAKLSHHPKRI